ncbi:MAG: hypothetical protein AABZ14_03865 [Candidatus Margulisiibacteriota bacterium]
MAEVNLNKELNLGSLEGNDILTISQEGDVLTIKNATTGATDAYTMQKGYTYTFNAGAGDDTITVDSSVDIGSLSLFGGDGNDTFVVNGRIGDIQGQAGNDTITVTAGGVVRNLYGGIGNDTFTVDGNAKNVYGDGIDGSGKEVGSGDDDITINGTVENVRAGAGADDITINGVVRHNVAMGAGADSLHLGASSWVQGDIWSGGSGTGSDKITIDVGAKAGDGTSGGTIHNRGGNLDIYGTLTGFKLDNGTNSDNTHFYK